MLPVKQSDVYCIAPGVLPGQAGSSSTALQRLEVKAMRNLILEEGQRADGRGLSDVRDIYSRCGLLPRVHGSALFTRGETQAIAVTTLGTGPYFTAPSPSQSQSPALSLQDAAPKI